MDVSSAALSSTVVAVLKDGVRSATRVGRSHRVEGRIVRGVADVS